MTDADLRTKLRAAIVDHLRWWLATDGVHIRRLHRDGRVDPATLRSIAKDYYVSRGLRQGQEHRIARLIEDRLEAWPESLIDRAEFVRELAESARRVGGNDQDQQLTHGLQLSAFSKMMWFLRPEGWTMYDKYAQWGLARPGKSLSFLPFYQRLAELLFAQVTRTMRGVLKVSAFPGLWPERIVDKYLMQCGQPASVDFSEVASQTDFLALQDDFFGGSVSRGVEALTDSLLAVVGDAPLFRVHLHPNPRQVV